MLYVMLRIVCDNGKDGENKEIHKKKEKEGERRRLSFPGIKEPPCAILPRPYRVSKVYYPKRSNKERV